MSAPWKTGGAMCGPRGTIVTDLDGVVFENHSRYFAPFWEDEDIPDRQQCRGPARVPGTGRPDRLHDRQARSLSRQDRKRAAPAWS